MVNLPKKECLEVLQLLNNNTPPAEVYDRYNNVFKDYLFNYATTKAVATNLINTLNKIA